MMRVLPALVLGLWAGSALAEVSPTPRVSSAELTQPTNRYDHAILGDAVEWGGLRLRIDGTSAPFVDITLPDTMVFEDVTARVVDLDGDGAPEVLVVQTDIARGAALAVYDAHGKRAATPFIGQTHRWLAPAGVGDFDGDGRAEIAYVDRPHLVRDLVFVRLEGDRLIEIARAPGLTNHRIGDAAIAGGARQCPGGDQVIVASADWTRALAVHLRGGTVQVTDLGPIAGPADLRPYLECPR